MDRTPRYRISDDARRLDRARVHELLSVHAYWALGRDRRITEKAIDGSRSWAAYDETTDSGADTGQLIGYARVVTDGATMAWLCDIIVDPARRGEGIGKALVGRICDDLEPLGLRRMILVTEDAHELYRQYGFELVEDGWKWMVRSAQPT